MQDAWWVCATNQQTLHHSQGCIFAVEISCEMVSDVLWHIGSFWLWPLTLAFDPWPLTLTWPTRISTFEPTALFISHRPERGGGGAKPSTEITETFATREVHARRSLAVRRTFLCFLCFWYEKIYITLQRKSRDKKGKSKHGFLAQKVLDFR